MLDDRTKSLLLALLYPVQFEAHPERGLDRVMRTVVMRHALQATPSDYLRAIENGLQSSDEKLSSILPLTHDEDTIRSYLRQLAQAFSNLPLATSVSTSRA